MFKIKKLEIDAAHNLIAMIMEEDAKELGIVANDRIKVINPKTKENIICVVEIIDFKKRIGTHKDINLKLGEIGIFELAFQKLNLQEEEKVNILLAEKPKSIDYVRKKFNGKRLNEDQFYEIMCDIVDNKYSEIEITFFVLACSVHKLNFRETVAITNAMVKVGKTLDFKENKNEIIVDKHCIGGVPGNRTTPIVVSIVAAFGLKIPKTSSRSITSPAGTADTMEVFTNVKVPLEKMKEIVKKTNGCLVWGGAFDLSPADDIIIHIEHPLRLDFEVQMIASILSKKKSAGSNHVLIDIPYGEEAKVTSKFHAYMLKRRFEKIGKAIGLKIKVINSDGSSPIGNGIGPQQEAFDIEKVLKNKEDAPKDLKEKSIMMAGIILEMSKKVKKGNGEKEARRILEEGLAYKKFIEIIEEQGKNSKLPEARYSYEVLAKNKGHVKKFYNKKISKLAFMLGAPKDKQSGIYLHKKLGESFEKEEKIFTIYSNSKLKLKYGLTYLEEEKIMDY